MPEYRISQDQGVCPEGRPCTLDPDHPTMRVCFPTCYYGVALLDVYAGPVGLEAYHEATEALRALMANHEAQEHPDHPRQECPGVEVCSSTAAFALRAIQDVLDPLPRDPDALHCDHCAKVETAADLTPDWNPETGNHRSCEAAHRGVEP